MEIKLTVQKGGNFKIEVIGAQNDSCTGATSGIEAKLGSVVDREFKPEAMISAEQQQEQQNWMIS